LTFSDLAIPPSVPRDSESAFTKSFVEPIATMFTVPTGYNFSDPACKGVDFICWPTVGASSIEYYASKGKGIAGCDRVLLVTTLKRGSLYVQPLTANGTAAAGHMSRYFQSDNRYRDTAVNPDGKTIYIATDVSGLAEAVAGGATGRMENPGAILAFTYVGEGNGGTASPTVSRVSGSKGVTPVCAGSKVAASGVPPQFTSAQSAAGKAAYNANCATCHGNTMTNGTFGPPLAGEYFRNTWLGHTVRSFFDKAKTMPPSAPSSLADQTYANIVAGSTPLPAGGAALDGMTIN
jgi:mono/diheme cytochrome c family protein